MIPVDYALGKGIVESCTCECGGVLSLPWGGSLGVPGKYVILCTKDPSHEMVVPVKSLTRMWKDGEEIPSFIKDRIENKFRREIMEQETVKAMVTKADADKLSNYVRAKFPKDLTDPHTALDFAQWCISHQLEPIRDCVPFHGTPYICAEWVDRQASGDKEFKGYSYKVFGAQDKEALAFDPQDLVIECQANFKGLDSPLVGLGVVTKDEREKKTEHGSFRSPIVATHPQQMCFKRARCAALKQRYHIPAPILEEVPYTTVVEAEYTVLHDEPPPYQPETEAGAKSGDPAEAGREALVVKGGGEGETVFAPEKGEETGKNREASARRDPESLKSLVEMFKACNAEFKLQPNDVIKELGYSSQFDITESPADCYRKIKGARD